jgi:hypothetical protein
MSLYKIASNKKTREKLKTDAVKRVADGTVLNGIFPGVGGIVSGMHHGEQVGHPNVGIALGTSGVNGAVAKDTGVGTLGETVIIPTIVGGTLGGLVSKAVTGNYNSIPAGVILGSGIGAIDASTRYGLGYLFGKRNNKNKNLLKRKKIKEIF